MASRQPFTEQTVTLEQLARLRQASRLANAAYDAARKQYKHQQKAQHRESRTEVHQP